MYAVATVHFIQAALLGRGSATGQPFRERLVWARRKTSATSSHHALRPSQRRTIYPCLARTVLASRPGRGHLGGCASANGLTGIGCVALASSRAAGKPLRGA